MTISVKHKFESLKGDGTDATLLRPSNWNDEHDLTLASGKILGRLTASTGPVEELAATSYMVGLLNTADFAALAAVLGLPTTGDSKLTLKTTADTGWVLMNDGSIGDLTSGATTLAGDSANALFLLLYANLNDTNAPLQTSTGVGTTRTAQGTAATAWSSHCRLVLPKQLGRALIVGGAGSGLTSRALGAFGGEETHQLTAAELASHTHTVTSTGSGSGTTSTVSNDHSHTFSWSGTTGAADRGLDHLHTGTTGLENQGHNHNYTSPGANNFITTGGGAFGFFYSAGPIAGVTDAENQNHNHNFTTNGADRSLDHLHGVSVSGSTGGISANHTHTVTTSVSVSGTTSSIGSDTAHNNMQPYAAWNIMVKL